MKIRDILLNDYKFNITIELAHYTYLCNEHLTRKQKNLLSTTEVRYDRYIPWKKHIMQKFHNYNKQELIELNRFLDLLLRNANKFKSFTQNFWMAFLSSFLTLVLTILLNLLTPENNLLTQSLSIIAFVPMLVTVIMIIYNNYSSEGFIAYFYKDIKAIVNEMIENHNKRFNSRHTSKLFPKSHNKDFEML